MNAELFYDNDGEQTLHFDAVQRLAQEEGFSEEEVRGIYVRVLSAYDREAKVRLFLPILVSRRVRDILHGRAAG